MILNIISDVSYDTEIVYLCGVADYGISSAQWLLDDSCVANFMTDAVFFRKVWVFADVPHLVKLVRRHVVKENGGLMVPDGQGGETLLDAAPFRALRAIDSAEMKICPKLTDLCIEVCNSLYPYQLYS